MAGVPEHSEQAPLLQGTRPGVRADASHRVMQGRRGLQIGRNKELQSTLPGAVEVSSPRAWMFVLHEMRGL